MNLKRWGGLFAAVAVAVTVIPAAPAMGAVFDDVSGGAHAESIEIVAELGVSTGCGDGSNFCPRSLVTRAQMASFLTRALDLPDSKTDWFTDDNGTVHEASINAVAEAGISLGIGNGQYSPEGTVTREQMASFITRALDLPSTSTDYFIDDGASVHQANINAVAEAGVTTGCTADGNRYCPLSVVFRDQMATFLVRMLGLDEYDIDVFIQPGTAINSVVQSSPTGTVFLLAPGTYREQQIEPRDGQVFLGIPGSRLNGSVRAANWVRDGSLWRHDGMTQKVNPFSGTECEDGGTACQFPEDVYIGNDPLRQVLSRDAVVAGTFYFDYGADRVYIADDPTGKYVEVSSTEHAFWGSADNVIIDGVTIEKYASPAHVGTIEAMNGNTHGNNWLVQDSVIRWNHGQGIRLGTNMRVIGNEIYENGQLGVAGREAHGSLVEGNVISDNNWAEHKLGWEAGGFKCGMCENVTLRGNQVRDNYGAGLWSDVQSAYMTFEGNTITGNHWSGIKFEISWYGTFRDNYIANNGFGREAWLWGAGILVQNSAHTEIYGNTLVNNFNSIAATHTTRSENPGRLGSLDVQDMHVYDNTITMATGLAGVDEDNGDAYILDTDSIIFENNTYILSNVNNGDHFKWGPGSMTASEWTATGQGSGSTFQGGAS